MNFDSAWEEMVERVEEEEIGEGVPQIEIRFDNENDGKCYATLLTPRFHKDIDEAKRDVKLAWETFCRPYEDARLESIERINLLYKKSA
nr:hypothetical protein [uncultured Butyrivibrio sp.]